MAPAAISIEKRDSPVTRKKTWQESTKLVLVVRELMKHGNVSQALRKAKAGRGWVYRRRKEDADYHDAFEEARLCGIEVLKDEAHRRAYEGILEPVFYQGDEVATVRKYSDTLLMFLIKQADPSYREHFQIDHGTAGGRPFLFRMTLHEDAVAAQQAST